MMRVVQRLPPPMEVLKATVRWYFSGIRWTNMQAALAVAIWPMTIGSDAYGKADLLSGVADGFDHPGFALHGAHAVNDAEPAHLAKRDSHGVLADGRHIGRDDGDTQRHSCHGSG